MRLPLCILALAVSAWAADVDVPQPDAAQDSAQAAAPAAQTSHCPSATRNRLPDTRDLDASPTTSRLLSPTATSRPNSPGSLPTHATYARTTTQRTSL